MEMPQMQPQPTMGAGMPVSDEQKRTLLDMIEKIKGKLGSVSAVGFAAKNKAELHRRDLLKQVFEKLQMAGVDLSSKESVADFILKLQQDSPELAAMFEKSMDVLLGGPEGGAFATPQDPNAQIDLGLSGPGNMNNTNPNEILSQAVPGRL